ncbi:MAG TPA: phosphoglycolate phosphatase [Rhodospirillaceae bacterium]|nr:phosphoglycolate phosphatase [Rhodospirillaceae bacterium]
MQRLEAVLFDLDGTLLDSAPDIRQALNLMLQDQGFPPLPLTTVKGLLGDGMMELCRKALLASGAQETVDYYPFVQKFIAYYRQVPADPAQIYTGGREMLQTLHQQGIKLAICTNKQEAATRHLLDQLDLSRYFTAIAGGDTFMVHKPHPGHVTGLLDAMEVKSQNALFIGDGMNDILACRQASVPCIIITHGYSEDWNALGADALMDGFDALPAMIEKLGFSVN